MKWVAIAAFLLPPAFVLFGCSKDGTSVPTRSGEGPDSVASENRQAGENRPSRPESGQVTLSEAAYATARVLVEPVRPEPGSAPGRELEVPGQVEFDPTRVAVVSSRAPARIEKLLAAPGDRVRAGQALAFLSSPEFVTAQSDFLQASRRAATLAGTADEAGARAIASAARRRLLLLGFSSALISRLESGGEPILSLPLTAPFTGSVVEAPGIVGTAVNAGDPVFRVADLSIVGVAASVPEASLSFVREGQSALVHVAAFPTTSFSGRVVRLRDELDPTTRTVKTTVRVPNANRLLRPGMFATVRLSVSVAAAAPGADASARLTLPETAVVTEGEDQFVFVEVGLRTFERRAVETSPLTPPGGVSPVGARLIVRSGLSEGDRVVVRGAFTLKSELAKSRLGENES